MTTPVQWQRVITPPPAGEGEKQFNNGGAVLDQSRREPSATPDYIALIEAELQAFQQELRRLETALNVQPGRRRK